MSISKASSSVREMFSSISTRYDLANTLLSFGIHNFWKRALTESIPSSSKVDSILDLCTGTGDLIPGLKKKSKQVIGVDFCFPMLIEGKRKIKMCADLILADALSLPFSNESFDVVTVAFGVRNFENLHIGLAEIFRVLKVGGCLLVLEFGQPTNFIFSKLYRLYSKFIIPNIGYLLTGNRKAYEYLPKTVEEFPSGEDFLKKLQEVGFTPQNAKPLTFGISYIYQANKR